MAPPKKKIDCKESTPAIKGDFMDWKYHREHNICDIPATSSKKKPDLFVEYKPKKGDKLDYCISQTYCKMDAGCTRINVAQTSAKYEPSKPTEEKKKKKVKYGRGPVWEFLEEKIDRKIEEMQAIYRKEFAAYRKRKIKERKEEGRIMHDKLIKRVGPDWYQELSPQQLRTVDNLERCIKWDIYKRTIINTKENIADLGLVLRPNSLHIEVALKYCCKCPVEFLLILYQIINPKRTKYSLNDKLLLSAVVHLTMRTTLKELHIRIPSPPKIHTPVEVKPKPKIPKGKKCPSPYLVPYTFKPQPRKFTGIYYDKHLDHPESPYFSYLEELKFQPKFVEEEICITLQNASDTGLDIIIEILEECSVAQAIYNKLAKDTEAPNLYMPNVYPQCIRVNDEGITILNEEPRMTYDDTKNLSYLAAIDVLQEQLIDLSQKFVIGGVTRDRDGLPVYIIVSVLPHRECPCAKKLRLLEKLLEIEEYKQTVRNIQDDLINAEKKFVIGGLTNGPDGTPVYMLSSVIVNRGICQKHRRATKEREYVETLHEKFDKQCQKFVLGSVTRGRNGKPVYEVRGVLPMKLCVCGKHEDIVKEIKDKRTPVEKSQDALKQLKQKFVISGVIVKDGFPIYIINTAYDTKDCVCGKHVLVNGKIQNKEKIMEIVQYKLTTSPTTYVIGGVTHDPDGLPVYSINAVVLRKQLCERHRLRKEGYKELCVKHKAIETLHTNLTSHKRKYKIGGVTYDRKGKPVFILSEVVVHLGICPKHLKIKMQHQEAMRAQANIISLKQKFLISGVAHIGYEGKPVYMIQCVVKPRIQCRRHKMVAIENDAIDKMQEEFRKNKQMFVISGATKDRTGAPVYILSNALRIRTACAHRNNLGPCINIDRDIVKRKIEEDIPPVVKECPPECNRKVDKYQKMINKLQDRLIYSSIKYVIGGLTFGLDGSPVYIITEVRKQRECLCHMTIDTVSDDSSSTDEDECDSVCDIEQNEVVQNVPTQLNQRCAVGCITDDEEENPALPISSVTSNRCDTKLDQKQEKKEEIEKDQLESLPLFYRLEAERIKKRFSESANKHVNGGVAIAPNGQPVFLIQASLPLRECPCVRAMRLKQEAERKMKEEEEEFQALIKLKVLADEEKLVEGKPMEDYECVCKEECEKFIKRTLSNRCQCEKCKEDLERAKKIFIIDGEHVEKGEPIHVIQGVTNVKECICLQQYRKKVERYEDLKARFEAKQNLKSLPKKYAVSGVTMGPDNKPIYILSGLASEKQCICATTHYEEQERLARAPKPYPEGSPKFIISGIKYSMDGTVYIVTGVVPIPDCKCMSIYDAFMERHTPCLELYDKFLRKVERETNKYMSELKKDDNWDNDSLNEECSCEQLETSEKTCYINEQEKSATCTKQPSKTCYPTDSKKVPKKTDKKSNKCKCKIEIQQNPECMCTEQEQCQALCKGVEGLPSTFEPEKSKRTVELKRYIILSKIPCRPIAQICILKEALESLANDGFPLAKLPDCYMLPHFKLWMEMRCGKYWTREDKRRILCNGQLEYSHILKCIRKTKKPHFPVTPVEANEFTYKKAFLYKRMVEEAKESYIRQEKQNRVSETREMFPLIHDYEFPTKTFRDSFFAYLQAKEEDCLIYRKWKASERKEMEYVKKCC